MLQFIWKAEELEKTRSKMEAKSRVQTNRAPLHPNFPLCLGNLVRTSLFFLNSDG
jgi:hypothetical protein